MSEENSYYNEDIDFYVEKPSDWVYFPTPWALNIRKRTALSNKEIAKIMEQSNTPFVYMQKPTNREDIAFPTAQATCRYLQSPTPDQMEQVARLQLRVLENNFSDYELLDFSTSKKLSDCPANYFLSNFSIKNEAGTVFKCTSQSWSVFWNNICYTIGLSGSIDNIEDYRYQHDEIIESILIGKAA